MNEAKIVAIWWRVLKPGEFVNIERDPGLVAGGGGARYVEIPSSMVADTLKFFGRDTVGDFTVRAVPIGKPRSGESPIDFRTKSGNRLRIANQNRQATPNRRHPAWSSDAGFPEAPDTVQLGEGSQYLPPGGVRVFIAKLNNGTYLAGFTSGSRPDTIPPDSPLHKLWVNTGVGGVIWDLDIPAGTGIAV